MADDEPLAHHPSCRHAKAALAVAGRGPLLGVRPANADGAASSLCVVPPADTHRAYYASRKAKQLGAWLGRGRSRIRGGGLHAWSNPTEARGHMLGCVWSPHAAVFGGVQLTGCEAFELAPPRAEGSGDFISQCGCFGSTALNGFGSRTRVSPNIVCDVIFSCRRVYLPRYMPGWRGRPAAGVWRANEQRVHRAGRGWGRDAAHM